MRVYQIMKYTDPYNLLNLQLDKNNKSISGEEPFNKIDEISMYHDICYRDNPQNKKIVIKLC